MQHSLTLTGKRRLEWSRTNVKSLEKDEILVRTVYGAISIGAELPQYDESNVSDHLPHYPRETGYESFGIVMEAGDEVTHLERGDHVVAFYGHKDLAVVKADKAVKVPEGVEGSIALLNTLSCDAAKGVLKLKPAKKDRVLVTGAGTMGLLAIHFLKSFMNVEHIDALEPNEARREKAKSFGADICYSDKAEIPERTYDYGLECSGRNEAFHALLKSLKHNGEACVLSDGNKELLRLNEYFYEKELKIVGSSDGWNYGEHARWFFDNCLKTPHLSSLFEHKILSHQLIDCFSDLSEGKINPIKVLVHYK
ncbi:zinc-binding alcohol dehydrogenase [Rossellomorea aquimaris]|uniref:zinc-dependent alcohol dehydrogenase n=1 Tax=Rossellomorea aquimaris TaxID=189382 RepID=UPI001CD33E69|nr:zinc-binding alcohol dehydrogenase [Rossellomorea aquimaris]MCA1053988.1 zinc-binding alcohol dehydrogenase [Rossellomorea aquimaris]